MPDTATPVAGPPPVITLDELFRRLGDDGVSSDQIRPYILPVPSSTGRIDPEFQPNPALVTGLERGLEGGFLVASLNAHSRGRRLRAYRERIATGWTGPRIVSEGDSWFQYPVFLRDIIDHLMEDHAVLSLDAAGDTLAGMVAQNEVIRTVAREQAQALLLSAGGNDLFQNGTIANLIEPVREGLGASDLVGARFDAFVAQIMADYRAMILRILAAHPDLRIFVHGYAAAFSRMDRWIGRPLRAKGVMPATVQNQVIELMLVRFNAAQRRLVSDPSMGGRVFHVDLTGLGRSPDDWHDEIHMDSTQNALAAKAFALAIRANLPAHVPMRGLEGGVQGASTPAGPAETKPVLAVAAHARDLLALDEGHLLSELDRRIALSTLDPTVADLPSMELLIVAEGGLEGGLPIIGAAARRLLRRWERELFDLLCGSNADDTKDRDKLREAMGLGQEALVGVVAGWLIAGPLGVPALLGGVLAALLVRRFGASTADEVCTIWKERLDA